MTRWVWATLLLLMVFLLAKFAAQSGALLWALFGGVVDLLGLALIALPALVVWLSVSWWRERRASRAKSD